MCISIYIISKPQLKILIYKVLVRSIHTIVSKSSPEVEGPSKAVSRRPVYLYVCVCACVRVHMFYL